MDDYVRDDRPATYLVALDMSMGMGMGMSMDIGSKVARFQGKLSSFSPDSYTLSLPLVSPCPSAGVAAHIATLHAVLCRSR